MGPMSSLLGLGGCCGFLGYAPCCMASVECSNILTEKVAKSKFAKSKFRIKIDKYSYIDK